MCFAPFPGEKVKGQGHTGQLKILSCLLHAYLTDLNSYVAQIQLMG